MTDATKPRAGGAMQAFTLPKVGGGEARIGGSGAWQMLVVYRGKHCPLCKKYLRTLDGLLPDFGALGIDVVAASADPEEKAESDVAEQGWRFTVAYGLTLDRMRRLGLYVSRPRSPQETDRDFAEPGLFVVNDAGMLQIIDVSNAPFARPDLAALLNGLKFVREKNYPIRGTV